MVNSRQKGAAFERLVCKILMDLLGCEWKFKRDIEQYRASGLGDIISDHPDWPFVIECKRYSKAHGESCHPNWYAQAKRAAEKADKLPIVIFKYDRRPYRVALPLKVIARASGCYAQDSDTLFETSLEGFAEIARELLAENSLKKEVNLVEAVSGYAV